jgi:hypothetical protein
MIANTKATSGPGPRDKSHSFDESVDEPAKLIESEAVGIEDERPATGNESLQQIEKPDRSGTPGFEEE